MSDQMTTGSGAVTAPVPRAGVPMPDIVGSGLGSSRYKEYDIPGYAQIVRARIPAAIWSGVYYSWLSMKGHLQALHDWDRTEFFATSLPDGDVEAVFAVIWNGAEALADYVENGYPVDEMLRGVGIPEQNIDVQLMRDFS